MTIPVLDFDYLY